MEKLIKIKLKEIEQYKKIGNSDKQIDDLKLEIYSMILGYYCAQKDADIFRLINNNDILNDLVIKIQKLLNTDNPLITIKNNSLDSIKICIKQLENNNKKHQDRNTKFFNSFILGYSNYKNRKNKYDSLFDYILLQKHTKYEEKLCKIKQKID